MDDLITSLGGEQEAPNPMTELAPPAPEYMTPISAIRNKAAAMALMAKGNVIQNYQETVQALQTNTLEQTRVYGEFHEGVRSDSVQGAMMILSSPEYSFEEKQKLIAASKLVPDNIPETNTRLAEQYLIEGSGDETESQELARISVADILDNQSRERQRVQGLVNAHGASLDANTTKAFFDWFAADILPFGNSVVQARLAQASGKGLWGTVKAFLLPGSSRAAMQEEYFEIPTEKQYDVAKKFVDLVGNNAGVLFPKDNDYAKFIKLQDILSGRSPDTFGTVMENLAPLFDVFGIGMEYKAGKLFLASKRAAQAEKAAAGLGTKAVDPVKPIREATGSPVKATTEARAPDTSLLAKNPSVPDPDAAKRRQTVTELEAEKARLLEDQNLAGRGDIRAMEAERQALRAPDTDVKTLTANIKKANPRMSSKDASIEAQKRLDDEMADYNARMDRLTQQIEANRSAAKTQQRIGDLEEQITALSKGVPEQAGSVLNPIVDQIRRIEWNNLARYDNPVSVGNIIGATNPAKARTLFNAMVQDETGEIAQAIYGTSKADAIAANAFPQAITESGVVTTKATDIARDLNPEIAKRLGSEGLEFSPAELAQADEAIAKRFSEISGLRINDAMGGITLKRDGGVANITAVYGTPEGGFATAKEAMEQALFALKEPGARADDIEILARDGINHRPISLAEAGDTVGEYYVRLKIDQPIRVTDIKTLDDEKVRWNIFDNITMLMGNRYTSSLTRNAVDVASMFSKRMSSSAIRASDVASGLNKLLIEEVKDFTDRFTALPKVRQEKVEKYLKEANAAGLKDNVADLVARGFSPEEMDTIKSFRNFHETTYHLENRDFVHTLNNEGFKLLVHPTERFVAKELQPNQWSEVREFLDPRTGNIERFDDNMRININNVGGQLAVLRRPVEINGKQVSHIFVDNNPTSYLRTIRDTDQVLSKLDGYYSVYYKAPRFVDRVTLDALGNEIGRKAVAVAGDWKSAENYAKRKSTTENERYEVRGDVQQMTIGNDDWVDINSSRGRISQRHRGQPLMDSDAGLAILGEGDFVLGPVDSAVRASRSLAGRVASREMLENAKARWVRQYGDNILPDNFGEKHFPSEVGKIGRKGIPSSKEIRDARSAWEYINYLENGYLNAADVVVRQMFNSAAVGLGRRGFSRTERVLGKVSEVAPVAALKSTVFNTLIGINFTRNIVVQNWQITRLPAIDPIAMARSMRHMIEFSKDLLSNTKGDFTKFVDDSNLLATVDQQNMIRGSIHNAIDHSNRVLSKADQGMKLARQVSFDIPEQMNLLIHLGFVYERALAKGLNVADKRVRAELFSEVRHLTGNMNFAGDMPYNQTAVSAVTQFMQAPHKFLFQSLNRSIPVDQRLRLLAWDLFFWGMPSAMVYNEVMEQLIPNEEARKIVAEGMWNFGLNQKILKDIYGSDKQIDIRSLAPSDVSGFYEIYQAVVTGGVDELMTHTPGGSLFGEKGKVQHAIRMWSQMFKGYIDETATPVQWDEALKATAEILPIVSNAYKAKLIYEYKERRNSSGDITEEDLTNIHAALQFLGFGSRNLADIYEQSKKMNEYTKAVKDDLFQSYQQSRRILASISEESSSDLETATRNINMLLSPFRDNPQAMKQLTEWLSRDMRGTDMNLHIKLMQLSGIEDDGTLRRSIEQLPISEEKKREAISLLQSSKDAYFEED